MKSYICNKPFPNWYKFVFSRNTMIMNILNYDFIKCGITGWCLEVFWTGFGSLLRFDRKMTGTTSLIMFPIYGMAVCLKPIYSIIKDKNLIINMCPWDYTGSKLNVSGLIRLDYAPAWFVTGLLMEKILAKKITA